MDTALLEQEVKPLLDAGYLSDFEVVEFNEPIIELRQLVLWLDKLNTFLWNDATREEEDRLSIDAVTAWAIHHLAKYLRETGNEIVEHADKLEGLADSLFAPMPERFFTDAC